MCAFLLHVLCCAACLLAFFAFLLFYLPAYFFIFVVVGCATVATPLSIPIFSIIFTTNKKQKKEKKIPEV
jgi:hypothetical protein